MNHLDRGAESRSVVGAASRLVCGEHEHAAKALAAVRQSVDDRGASRLWKFECFAAGDLENRAVDRLPVVREKKLLNLRNLAAPARRQRAR